MLSGTRVYDGETATDIISKVLTADPDWSRLPAGIPPPIRHLLGRCLTRDVKLRLQAIGEARIAIDDAMTSPEGHASAVDGPRASPDGKTIAFRGDRTGGQLFSRAFGQVGDDQQMLKSDGRDSPSHWS